MHRYFLLPALVFSLLIAVIYSIEALKAPEVELSDAAAMAAKKISIMQGVSVVSTRQGQRAWTLESPRIEISGNTVNLFSVDAIVDGHGLRVRALAGQYNADTGELSLAGGVKITGQGYTMSTAKVEFDADSRTFSSRDNVVMDGEGYRLLGKGMEVRGENVRLLSDVKAFYY